jgi:sugar-specific transcriptional regulator TrmB
VLNTQGNIALFVEEIGKHNRLTKGEQLICAIDEDQRNYQISTQIMYKINPEKPGDPIIFCPYRISTTIPRRQFEHFVQAKDRLELNKIDIELAECNKELSECHKELAKCNKELGKCSTDKQKTKELKNKIEEINQTIKKTIRKIEQKKQNRSKLCKKLQQQIKTLVSSMHTTIEMEPCTNEADAQRVTERWKGEYRHRNGIE